MVELFWSTLYFFDFPLDLVPTGDGGHKGPTGKKGPRALTSMLFNSNFVIGFTDVAEKLDDPQK